MDDRRAAASPTAPRRSCGAAFIEQHLSEFPAGRKIKVASLVQNNDFGKLYDPAFKAYVAQSPTLKDRIDYVSETIEAAAPTVTDPMTTLAAKNPDVFIAMLAGTPCTQIVTEAAQNGMHGEGQVPVPAADLRRRRRFVEQGEGRRRRLGRRRLVDREPGHQGHQGPGLQPATPTSSGSASMLQAKGIDPDTSVEHARRGINYGCPGRAGAGRSPASSTAA